MGSFALVGDNAAVVLVLGLVYGGMILGGLPWLRPAHVQHVLRIIQEAVLNAARHSGAGRVRVEATAGRARITVRDTGRGGVQARDGSFGLRSMRRRAEELGAGLHIVSDAGGTAVVLDLPLAASVTAAA